MIVPCSQTNLDQFCALTTCPRSPEMRGIMDVRDGVIIACVAFDCWTHNSSQMHMWAAKTFSRSLIRASFEYLFVTCNKGLAIGVTPGNNRPALEFSRRRGFTPIAEIPDAWQVGTPLVIQHLRKDDCRWICPKKPQHRPIILV